MIGTSEDSAKVLISQAVGYKIRLAPVPNTHITLSGLIAEPCKAIHSYH